MFERKERYVRPRRRCTNSNSDLHSTRNTVEDDEIHMLRTIRSTRFPFVASSTLAILIAGLSTVESFPLTFQNHNNHNGIIHHHNRIRTTAADCQPFHRENGGRITSNDATSNHRFASAYLDKKTRLCMGQDDILEEDDEMVEHILFDDIDEDLDDKEFLKRQLAHLESMEKMLEDIDEYCSIEGMCEDDDGEEEMDDDDEDEDEMMFMGDVDDLEDMDSLFEFLEENAADFGEDMDDEEADLDFLDENEALEFLDEKGDSNEISSANADASTAAAAATTPNIGGSPFSPKGLEEALLQGVVPVDAGVGSNTLPGDFGFDPLGFAEKDYVLNFQYRFLDALPGGNPDNDPPPPPRPTALVLRDYREAEIRHGRLAMLAVMIWPIQEKLDQFFLEPNQRGPLLYGPVTLPYLPLFMTLLMMLLGYLDIYTKDIQEEEGIGDAFLPGDCFWDPLKVLDGAPASMKRNMQERELFNGRVAMLAFAAFVFEEATSHEAIIDIPGNEVLFVPAYQIPTVQEWLDSQFLTYSN